jgi:hypothetical protein
MLNAKNFALAGGIIWGLSACLFILFILITGSGQNFINFMLSSFISDYKINWLTSIIVLLGGFIKGFIIFYLFAYIYNYLSKKPVIQREEETNY